MVVKTIAIEELSDLTKAETTELLINGYAQYEAGYNDPAVWNDYVNSIKESLNNPNLAKVLIAKAGEEIVGSLQLYLDANAAYGRPELAIQEPIIRLLAVHPEARGNGIAQKLIFEAQQFARERQAAYLYLHTTDMMASAVRLYEYLGFKRYEQCDFQNANHLVKCYRYQLGGI